jgi:hypothetical protein
LGFKDGLSLVVYDIKDEIYIEKNHEDSLLNQAVLSNGNLTIPCELRKILKLEGGATLCMEINPALNRIKLKKQCN